MMPMHSRLRLAAVAALALGLAAGCSSVEPDPASGTAGAGTTGAVAETTAGQAAGSPTTAGTQGFGTTIQWEGLDVSVSHPAVFNPTKIASYPQGSKRFVSVDFNVTNTSDQPLQTGFLTTEARSAGKPAGRVADSDKGIGAPTTAIAPGASLAWKEAYPMPGNQLLLTVKWAPPGAEPVSTILSADSYPTPTPTATATTGGATGTGTGTATDAAPSGETTTQ